MPDQFLRLQDFLLPLPLPALLTVLVVSGVWFIGDLLARGVWQEDADCISRCLAFVVVSGLLAAAVHLLALAGLLNLWLLRSLAWALAACGVAKVVQLAKLLRRRWWRDGLSQWSRSELAILMLIGLIGLAMAGAALGPPTDADSLDYHLGVPLAWLRFGGAFPSQAWFHSRLVGIGECLNLLGLAGGTDNLGAGMQFAGLIVACIAVGGFAARRDQKLFAALLVVSCPVILFLVPNQKPQMLPIAAGLVGMIALWRSTEKLDRATIAAALFCCAFAGACKYSFALTVGIVAVSGLIAAKRAGKLGFAIASALVASAILVVPVLFRNLVFYGDPLSPMLERFRPDGDPALVAFAQHLRGYGGGIAVRRFARLPFDLMVTLQPGRLSTILGVGLCTAILMTREAMKKHTLPLLTVGAALIATLGFGQITARFFLGPFLWFAAVVVTAAPSRRRMVLQCLLFGQGLVVLLMAGVGAVTLLPGALSAGLRDQVMTRCAYQYAQAKWLDDVLSEDAVIMAQLRSNALLPRPFVLMEQATSGPLDQMDSRLAEICRKHPTLFVAIGWPMPKEGPIAAIAAHAGTAFSEQAEFREATRNPFNRGGKSTLWVFNLDCASPDHSAAPAAGNDPDWS